MKSMLCLTTALCAALTPPSSPRTARGLTTLAAGASGPQRQILLVAAGVLAKSGRVLLQQRSDPPQLAGLWEFPGGRVPEGSDDREVLREKLDSGWGIVAEIGELNMEVLHHYEEYVVHMAVYEARLVSGPTRGGDRIKFVAAAELEKHEAALAQSNESARRIHARQRSIIEKLYECDAKQAEDEFTAQLEFAKARIVDSLEKKAAKGSSNPGAFGRSRPNGAANGAAGGSGEPAEKRPRTSAGGLGMLPAATFALLPADVKADLDAITADVQHYTPRGAEDIVMRGQGGDVYFDKVRSRLHINQLTFERGHAVYVLQQNTRVDDDPWEISAINSLEVTLRDTDSVKHKIQLAQLRSGRHAFKHAGRRPAENAW